MEKAGNDRRGCLSFTETSRGLVAVAGWVGCLNLVPLKYDTEIGA